MQIRFALRMGLVVPALVLAGCAPRFKGVEAYYSATTTNPEGTYRMDPGSFGGTAEASGGLNAGASYGTGASDAEDGNKAHYEEMEKVRAGKPDDWAGGTSYEVDAPPAE